MCVNPGSAECESECDGLRVSASMWSDSDSVVLGDSSPALDSFTLRDYVTYPTTSMPTTPVTELMDIDDLTLTFDPVGLFQVMKQWTSITHPHIFGIDDLPSDDLSLPPDC
jgi:hypothetical protein